MAPAKNFAHPPFFSSKALQNGSHNIKIFSEKKIFVLKYALRNALSGGYYKKSLKYNIHPVRHHLVFWGPSSFSIWFGNE